MIKIGEVISSMNILEKDEIRYSGGDIPLFQKAMRWYQQSRNPVLKLFYKIIFAKDRNKRLIEMSINTCIGEGLYLGHAYCININPNSVIGKNCNIHKGVTIGQENRGERKGAPVIGNEVWIGINTTIVGHVHIGNDVLIAPNSYVNCDIPDHSVVFGNPCIIKANPQATESYINRKIE